MASASLEYLPSVIPADLPDQVQGLLHCTSDQQMRIILHLSGRLDRTRLEHALRETILAFPILMYRYSMRDDGTAFVRGPIPEFAGYGQDVETTSDATLQDDRLTPAVFDAISAPSDASTGPLFRVAIVRRPSGDTLCFIVDHLVGDATSIKAVLRYLAASYTRHCEGPLSDPPASSRCTTTVGTIGDRSLRSLRSALRPTDAVRFPVHLAAMVARRIPGCWSIRWERDAGPLALHLRAGVFSSDALTVLKERGRRLGATVNDVLLAIYFRALTRTMGRELTEAPERQRVICTPCDLRRHLPRGTPSPVGNFSSAYDCNLGVEVGASLTDTIGRTKAAMDRQKYERAELRLVAPCIVMPGAGTWKWGPYRVLRRAISETHDTFPPAMANLGIVDTDALRFGPLRIDHAVAFGPIGRRTAPMLVAASVGGRLSLSVGVASSARDGARVSALWEALCDEVRDATDGA